MILKENDVYDLSQALQRAPGASHSRGRTVLVENLSYSTSLSGLLRQFEGFHMQEHAATLLEAVRQLATALLQLYTASPGCMMTTSVGLPAGNPWQPVCMVTEV